MGEFKERNENILEEGFSRLWCHVKWENYVSLRFFVAVGTI